MHVADVAFGAYTRSAGTTGCLVGAPDELVGGLEQKLHPYLRERVVARLHLDVENSSVDDGVRAAANADRGLAARRARALGGWPRRQARRPRRGGPPSVLRALNEQQVETLLVDETFHSAGGRDPETGMLYPGDHRPGDQGSERCENIVEPAIEKAIEQSARVIKVRYHDDLGPLGGIGAVLRCSAGA